MQDQIRTEAIKIARRYRHSQLTQHHILLAWARINTELEFEGKDFVKVNSEEQIRGLVAAGLVSTSHGNDLDISERGRYWLLRLKDEYNSPAAIEELMHELELSTSGINSRKKKPAATKAKKATKSSTASSAENKSESVADSKEESTSEPIETVESLLAELDALIGIDTVKVRVRQIMNQIEVNKARVKAGQQPVEVGLSLVFTGSPGTGKTTVARLLARIYRALGVLESGHLVEVGESDLVGSHQGETTEKTERAINKAMGGILFIDEAYSLSQKDVGKFGQQAITALVAHMENHRTEFAVIVAGYTQPMQEFLKSNAGLKSRFTTVAHFPDYSPEDLTKIVKSIAAEHDIRVDEKVEKLVLRHLTNNPTSGSNGNGRYARKLFVRMYELMSERAMEDGIIEDHEIEAFQPSDVPSSLEYAGAPPKLEDVLAELDSLVGLSEVKQKVKELAMMAKAQKALVEKGLPTVEFNLNLVFAGSPGTGKTTIARILTKAYQSIGVLSRGHLVEVGRSDLVGEYLGQTAPKTMAKIEEATGGVLFIDEAYSLMESYGNGQSTYGQEAIATIVMEMENRREHLAVIAAGYEEDMKLFVESNPGLKSRFDKTIIFPDYTKDELVEIFKGLAAEKLISVSPEVENALLQHFQRNKAGGDEGNGRYVRKLFQRAYTNLVMRVCVGEFEPEELSVFAPVDIPDKLSNTNQVPAGFQPNPN